ncbi:hypothetical protein DEU56DRAFT_841738 [Suillus clintonianus]|uniref:uncharacterized protein n=1 Tax=Suillus clintonianus TaxID=1904413 RepID=UPI001B866D64|nr:uncharacterized protein DEU56DRAFT_841738 [Suillus clintonianus]KAG2114835.1 hypothetical protein DEU56DRAFT_841738 [Suillus clintonianus]
MHNTCQVEAHGKRLTISEDLKRSEDYGKGAFAVRERSYGKFSRTLQIHWEIKASTTR